MTNELFTLFSSSTLLGGCGLLWFLVSGSYLKRHVVLPISIGRLIISSARNGQTLPRFSLLFLVQSCLYALSQSLQISKFGNQLSVMLLIVCGSINIIGYVLLIVLYRHSIQTIFNRQIPDTIHECLPSFGAHLQMLRPIEIIWRYYTSSWRILPDIIVLGEVRCGTTSICQHLADLKDFDCHTPFCLWKHPELDHKETFYFVGHYLGKSFIFLFIGKGAILLLELVRVSTYILVLSIIGNVTPRHYRMCFPLKITKWWNERILKRPFFTFDGCAQYLTSPTAAALIAETYRQAGQDPPVLVACVRSPVDQAISWWRYENNAIEWGASMGLTDWNTKLRTNAYPPRAIGKALEFANSTEVQRLYSNAADLVTTKTDSKCLDSSALATQYRYRLPPWAMTWPGGQLSTIGRNGKFCFNISRFETIFAAVFAENANVVGKHTPKSSEEKNGKKLQYVSVVPLECMSAGSPLADALASIMEQAACRRYFNSDLPIFFDAKESLACIDQSITTQFQSSIKVRRNSGTKLSNLDMEPTSEDEVMLSKYFEKEMESLSRLAGLNFMCDGE